MASHRPDASSGPGDRSPSESASGLDEDEDAGPDTSAVRVFAVAALAVWWVIMFGLIDLSVPFAAVPQDMQFYDAFMLEAGWGLLYTVLLGVPALMLVCRPVNPDAAVQHVTVGAALALTALATPELGHLVPAAAAIGLGLGVLGIQTGKPRPPSGYLRLPTGLWWAPATIAALAAAPAVVYAFSCVQAARAGVVTDDTWGLDHWPAQGASAVAVVLVAVQGIGARGRVPAWCAAVSAAWFGAFSVVYPAHAGSLGTVGGVAAIAVSAVYVTSWEVALWSSRRLPDPLAASG